MDPVDPLAPVEVEADPPYPAAQHEPAPAEPAPEPANGNEGAEDLDDAGPDPTAEPLDDEGRTAEERYLDLLEEPDDAEAAMADQDDDEDAEDAEDAEDDGDHDERVEPQAAESHDRLAHEAEALAPLDWQLEPRWGVRLLSTVPEAQPPRAVLGLPDGQEVVVQAGELLPEAALIVMAIGREQVHIAEVTPRGDHARVESRVLTPLYPSRSASP